MLVSVLIGGIILLYSLYVIRKRIKEVKAGKFCSGSCGGCSGCSKGYSNRELH